MAKYSSQIYDHFGLYPNRIRNRKKKTKREQEEKRKEKTKEEKNQSPKGIMVSGFLALLNYFTHDVLSVVMAAAPEGDKVL